MKRKIKYVLCDTAVIPEYEEYLEHCRANDIEPQEEDSDDYWDYVTFMQELEMRDLKENLKYSSQNNTPVLITGTLQLWNGKPEIYPMRCESLWDAIRRCSNSNSIDKIRVEYDNGVVRVHASHHDGTNVFEIHKLSKKGIQTSENWYNNTNKDCEVKGYWLAKFHGYLF